MACQTYEVRMNIRVNGTWNRWFKPREPIDENFRGRLQRYAVLGRERNQKIIFEYKHHSAANIGGSICFCGRARDG
jgi:hypothetical protein